VLELGKAGSSGWGKNVVPVLRDGAVVATLHASNWKEKATALIDGREWNYAKERRELTARWFLDPEGTARFRARQVSFWKGSWDVDLEGTPVEVRTASWWRTTHRYLVGGREVMRSGAAGLGQRPTLDGDGGLTLPQLVFLLWLELVVRRRAAAATAAT